jgi:hypothetical protein
MPITAVKVADTYRTIKTYIHISHMLGNIMKNIKENASGTANTESVNEEKGD